MKVIKKSITLPKALDSYVERRSRKAARARGNIQPNYSATLAELIIEARKGAIKIAAVLMLVFAISGCTPAIGADAKLLRAISFVESSHNPNAIGDGGAATGQFQLHDEARADARQALKLRPDQTVSESKLADTYLDILTVRFQRRTGRIPNPGEVYGCYNLGFAGFQRIGFDLSRAPKTTRRAAAKVQRMCQPQMAQMKHK